MNFYKSGSLSLRSTRPWPFVLPRGGNANGYGLLHFYESRRHLCVAPPGSAFDRLTSFNYTWAEQGKIQLATINFKTVFYFFSML